MWTYSCTSWCSDISDIVIAFEDTNSFGPDPYVS